jgi:hypothetical protein
MAEPNERTLVISVRSLVADHKVLKLPEDTASNAPSRAANRREHQCAYLLPVPEG